MIVDHVLPAALRANSPSLRPSNFARKSPLSAQARCAPAMAGGRRHQCHDRSAADRGRWAGLPRRLQSQTRLFQMLPLKCLSVYQLTIWPFNYLNRQCCRRSRYKAGQSQPLYKDGYRLGVAAVAVFMANPPIGHFQSFCRGMPLLRRSKVLPSAFTGEQKKSPARVGGLYRGADWRAHPGREK